MNRTYMSIGCALAALVLLPYQAKNDELIALSYASGFETQMHFRDDITRV